jgi:hypothetical protein
MRKVVVRLVETSAIKSKPFFGTIEKVNYCVNVNGVPDGNTFPTLPFGRSLDAKRFMKTWVEGAKTAHVDCKGKPTMSTVKQWIKDNKPSEFYAQWRADSKYDWKDDSVKICYK